eukprot:884652-Amorphochlora_amoeboformis.AAC.1
MFSSPDIRASNSHSHVRPMSRTNVTRHDSSTRGKLPTRDRGEVERRGIQGKCFLKWLEMFSSGWKFVKLSKRERARKGEPERELGGE